MSKRRIAEKPEVHAGSANVYRDLGVAHADEMLVKAQLVTKIRDIIRDKGLTQVEVAAIVGLPQPKLSGILRGRLTGLGRDVEIVVKEAPRRRAGGRVTVVFA